MCNCVKSSFHCQMKFSEQVEVAGCRIRRIRWIVDSYKMVRWRIIMQQSPASFFTVFWPNSSNAWYQTLQNTDIKHRDNYLANGNKLFMHNTLAIVKTNQHWLNFWLLLASFFLASAPHAAVISNFGAWFGVRIESTLFRHQLRWNTRSFDSFLPL